MSGKIIETLADETCSLGSFIIDNVFDELNKEDQELFLRSTEVLATIMANLGTNGNTSVSIVPTNQQVH
jgi:hypothetical protein